MSDKDKPSFEPSDKISSPNGDDDYTASPTSSKEDISLDDSLVRQANKNKKQRKPKNKKQTLLAGAGVFLLLCVLIVYGCQPRQGSMAFGICSVFLELGTPYAHTLNFSNVEGSQTAVRIYFTSVDPFGEYKKEMLECTFGPDKTMGMKLTKVERNRRAVPQSEIEKFNRILPSVIASDPYRLLPPNWKNPLLKDGGPMYESQLLPE